MVACVYVVFLLRACAVGLYSRVCVCSVCAGVVECVRVRVRAYFVLGLRN